MTSTTPAKPRPLSPHLGIYKPQISSVMSFLHRATGCALAFGMLVFVAWATMLAGGTDTYAFFTANLNYALGQIGIVIGVWVIFWYALNFVILNAASQSSCTVKCAFGFLDCVAGLGIALLARYFFIALYADLSETVFTYAGTAMLVGITWSFFYHFFNGLRHLMWDAGWFLTLRGMHITGWITVLLSLAPTAALWANLWGYIP